MRLPAPDTRKLTPTTIIPIRWGDVAPKARFGEGLDGESEKKRG